MSLQFLIENMIENVLNALLSVHSIGLSHQVLFGIGQNPFVQLRLRIYSRLCCCLLVSRRPRGPVGFLNRPKGY